MSRIRVIALSMGMVIASLLAHSVSEAQQGGPPGGGRGRGGGFGGFGGFNSLISLATRPGVQAELKLTDKQKADVKALSDKIDARRKEQDARRKEQFEKYARERGNGENNGPGRRFGGPRGKGENPPSRTETADAGTGSTKGKAADSKSKTGKASAKGKTAAGGTGGPRNDFFAAFRKQQQEDEGELSKILTPTQRPRLLQIKLQLDGPNAFGDDDLQKKLAMTPSQAADVEAILDESRRAQFEQMRERFRGQGGDQGNNRGQGGDQGNRGQGGDQGNNNNRGRGNRGPGGLSREEYQKKMDTDPQFKAEQDARRREMEEQNEQFRNQTMQQIAGVLSKKQKVAYNKMLGTPFDRAKLARDYNPATAPQDESSKSKTSGSSKKKTTSKTRKSA